jgi:23S rRNA (cytidine1920-2'-O)/16S rRNA (cytidine1409-2'-O)-methyltransferase
MATRRRRVDRELVARGLASTEAEAVQLVIEHRVLVDGALALQPNRLVTPSSTIALVRPAGEYVTRGGVKLAGALDQFGIDPAGRRCLDAGAGAGGFTDCLLRRGAATVVAVDVGYGDFDWALRSDPRVRLLERTNLRVVEHARLGGPYDLAVADLSFISLVAVARPLAAALAADGDLVVLVKPQFEAPREDVAPGGVVTEPEVWRRSLERVAGALGRLGLGIAGVSASRLRGAEGNQEFFLWACRSAPPLAAEALQAALGAVAR